MTRRKDKFGTVGTSEQPSAGQRVVLDANVVIDLVLSDLMPPTLWANAARRVLAICCVACFSEKLWNEVLTNLHKRGVPAPRAAVLGLREDLRRREKLIHLNKSQIEATELSKDVHWRAPHEDRHVVQLALAANARWVITADDKLREAAPGFRLKQPLSPGVARVGDGGDRRTGGALLTLRREAYGRPRPRERGRAGRLARFPGGWGGQRRRASERPSAEISRHRRGLGLMWGGVGTGSQILRRGRASKRATREAPRSGEGRRRMER
jgi:predicted nucleic acid-binding protein